jgi:hypothetical protein
MDQPVAQGKLNRVRFFECDSGAVCAGKNAERKGGEKIMEAVQILQNPGTLISGRIGASGAGLMADPTTPPIFEQMFAQATAVAAIAEKVPVESVLPRSAVQAVSLADIPALPLAGPVPVQSAGDPDAAESSMGEVVEASPIAKASLVSEAGFDMTQMLVRSREKTGKTLERKESSQGNGLEKKGESPTVLPEGEMKSVISESGGLKKQEEEVDSQEETGSAGISISLDEKASEGFSAENGMAYIPVMQPEPILTPTATAGNRTIMPDAVFQVPARSAFASAEAGLVNATAASSPVHRQEAAGSGPFGTAVVDLKTPEATAFRKAGDAGSEAKTSASLNVVVHQDNDDPEAVAAPVTGQEVAVRKLGRVADSDRENKAVLNAVKGEAVLRQVPSGVTVANPAQTILMGASPLRGEATSVTGRGREYEAESVREADEGNQQISEALLSEADQGGARKGIPVSSGEAPSQQNAGEGKENRQFFSPISPSERFEKSLRVRTEETPQTSERTELHDSILSQVREKLASAEPGSGNGQITLKLNPRELGDLQIHLRMQDSKVSVEITAQNPVVRDALVQNLDQLKETLSRQNIAMERFDVMTGNGQTSNQSFREGRQAAQPHFDNTYYPDAGFYPEDSGAGTIAYGEVRENSLVDMRF